MTGRELAAWLMANAADMPVTMMGPDYARHMPVEIAEIEIRRDTKYIPCGSDAIVALGEHVLLLADDAEG